MIAAVRNARLPLIFGVYASAVVVAPSSAVRLALCAPIAAAPLVAFAVLHPRTWIALFFVCALLLPPLPFSFGDTGPHVGVLIAALGVAAGLVRLSAWRVRVTLLTASMAALFFILLASTALALFYSGPAIASASFIRVLLLAISIYMFLYAAYGPAQYQASGIVAMIRLLFVLACISAAFACADFYFQFPAPAGFAPQFVWLDSGVYRRAQGVFYDASTLGNLCACFLVMIAVSLFRRWRPVPLWGMLTGAAALSAALIFSYSRASLLNVVAAIAANLCLERGRLRRILPIAGAFVIAGMAVAGSAAHGLAQTYWLRLASTVEYLFVSPEGVLSGRVASWRTLVDFVSAHPWRILFGIGYKTLPYSDVAGRPVVADNMYLSLLVETGVAGLAALLVFNAALLQAARRAARSDDVQAAFLGRWMFCFWIGQMVQMLSGDLLTYWRILPVYFWLFAMMAPRADPVH